MEGIAGLVGADMLSAQVIPYNLNATVARTMLRHFGQFSQGALTQVSLGMGFGFIPYLKDIAPGFSVYFGIKDTMEACF